MPRIGRGTRTKKEFLARTEELMDIARESLEIKRKVLEGLTEKNLYPYTKRYLQKMKETHGEYWKSFSQ